MTPVNLENMLGRIVGLPQQRTRAETLKLLRDALAGYDVAVATEREASRNMAICELKGMDTMATEWARKARKALQHRMDLHEEIDGFLNELEEAA